MTSEYVLICSHPAIPLKSFRFLDMAYASAREVEYQASLAFRLGYVSQGNSETLCDLCAGTSKVLNGLLRALRKQ